MKSLVEITDIVYRVEKALIETNGEITPEIEAMLEVKENELPVKVDSYSVTIDKLHHEAQFLEAQADRLATLAKSILKAREGLKTRMKDAMMKLGVVELEGETTKIRLQNAPPKVIIEDETKIEGQYLTTEIVTRADKKKIANALKDGIKVDGARLEQDLSLRFY